MPITAKQTPDGASKEQPAPESIWDNALDKLRQSLPAKDDSAYNASLLILLDLQEEFPALFPENPVAMLCNSPFDPDWFSGLPLHAQFYALRWMLLEGLLFLRETKAMDAYLQDEGFIAELPEEARPSFAYLLISNLLIRGQIAAAEAWLTRFLTRGPALGLAGWANFLAEKNDAAIRCYEEDLRKIRKANHNEKAYFTGPEGIFYPLALLCSGDYRKHRQIRAIAADLEEMQPRNPFRPAAHLLLALVEARENRLDLARERLAAAKRLPEPHSITTLFQALVSYWIYGKPEAADRQRLRGCLKKAAAVGQTWLAREYASLLSLAGEKTAFPAADRAIEGRSLAGAITPEEQWQHALRALSFSSADSTNPGKPGLRLAWFLDCRNRDIPMGITPKIQRALSGGRWSKGRPLALKALCREPLPDFLVREDEKICEVIRKEMSVPGQKARRMVTEIMPTLIGHPHLFLAEDPATRVEVLQGEPELRVEHQGESALLVGFFPWPDDQPAVVIRENKTRFRVFPISAEHRRIAGIVGRAGLAVPPDAKEKLLATLGDVSSLISVHSPGGESPAEISEAAPDARIVLQLTPYGEGLRLAMLVRPLQPDGPCLRPGEGPKVIRARQNGRPVQTTRDLAREEENALIVEAACPTLAGNPNPEREWLLPEPEESLQLLLELQELSDKAVVEWPEGKRFTVSPPAGLNLLSLTVRKRNNWFEIDGALKLNETLILDMRALLALAGTTPSRFVPLGHGHFLALSRELRKRLEELTAFAELRKNSLRVHPLAVFALKGLTGKAGFLQADEHWARQEQMFLEAGEYAAEPPGALRGELRDYQLAGFRWLARLARAGIGACLADDMGLGKTVQTLALILARAGEGPSLVVAPTSVCLNWQDEARRFAPGLRVIIFGGRERKNTLTGLGPFDLLICSYGLLRQESGLLSTMLWQTIVLDEAQAIKNFLSKRSRAAMLLKGHFKMITTGTPIENHLAELWSLFQFINPGLLGSLSRFNQRFAIPIGRDHHEETRRKLKKLLSPFILRRLKAEVQEELPPRTEIVLQVEMGEKEAALYTALREKALENLSRAEGRPGKRSLMILSEIMKLRRACCHPRLVLPNADIPGAKLDLFGKLIAELKENGHKALVFSQFVAHLAIVRAYLDQAGIPYKYLDGSTPPQERQRQVREFQGGEGDLFLISLKAGGLGLNLTAADYVIHLDPWWNPAVEDQASDRAHRIGQTRPVTIYRLVMKNSIEEKIVRLHEEKRALADSLLEGADSTALPAPEELLRILREA